VSSGFGCIICCYYKISKIEEFLRLGFMIFVLKYVSAPLIELTEITSLLRIN